MALSRYERETIINYNEEESTANIFTASATMAKRLEKIGEVKAVSGGWELEVPKSWVTIKKPVKRSQKQLEVLARAREKAKKAIKTS